MSEVWIVCCGVYEVVGVRKCYKYLQGEVRGCCVRMMYIVQECGVCCVMCGWSVVGVGCKEVE